MTKYLVQCNFNFNLQEKAEDTLERAVKVLYFLISLKKKGKKVICSSDKLMKKIP